MLNGHRHLLVRHHRAFVRCHRDGVVADALTRLWLGVAGCQASAVHEQVGAGNVGSNEPDALGHVVPSDRARVLAGVGRRHHVPARQRRMQLFIHCLLVTRLLRHSCMAQLSSARVARASRHTPVLAYLVLLLLPRASSGPRLAVRVAAGAAALRVTSCAAYTLGERVSLAAPGIARWPAARSLGAGSGAVASAAVTRALVSAGIASWHRCSQNHAAGGSRRMRSIRGAREAGADNPSAPAPDTSIPCVATPRGLPTVLAFSRSNRSTWRSCADH